MFNNFLMWYPDSFGVVIKKIALGPNNIILKAQPYRENSFRVMLTFVFRLIRVYRKNGSFK